MVVALIFGFMGRLGTAAIEHQIIHGRLYTLMRPESSRLPIYST